MSCAIFSVTGFAASIEGVDFPDTVQEQGKTLALNGLGVRTYWSFNVYAAGLYLETKSADENSILDSKSNKFIKMHYFRDVGQSDARKVWKKSFESYCPPPCEKFKDSIEKFNSQVTDIKKGSSVSYYFTNNSLEIRTVSGSHKIEQAEFPKMVLSTWIGKNPPTDKLKNGLLGK